MPYPESIQKLIEYFTKLPGVGPRAAGRFVFALLKQEPEFLQNFGKALSDLPSRVGTCRECFLSIEKSQHHTEDLCRFCNHTGREKSLIMVLEKESDLNAVEKSNLFKGRYHVLGGTLSPLDPQSTKKLKIRELYNRIQNLKSDPKTEVILATNPTPEGDITANYIEKILEPLAVKVTRLGRGITSGSELEYVDETTIRNALNNRK